MPHAGLVAGIHALASPPRRARYLAIPAAFFPLAALVVLRDHGWSALGAAAIMASAGRGLRGPLGSPAANSLRSGILPPLRERHPGAAAIIPRGLHAARSAGLSCRAGDGNVFGRADRVHPCGTAPPVRRRLDTRLAKQLTRRRRASCQERGDFLSRRGVRSSIPCVIAILS